MGLTKIAISDFRNIATAELSFSPQLNLIAGCNGAGKTSLLEAVYFLGRAQSFRTTHPSSVIREGAEGLLVTGQVTDRYSTAIPVGIQRDKTSIRVKMAGRPVQQLAELVVCFPFQLLTPDSHQLLEGGPRYRRRFLDWGVFHVEPAFFPAWQRYSRALRQRNAALKARALPQEIRLWDTELIAAAQILDQQRRDYLHNLLPVLGRYATGLLVDIVGLGWEYRPGWPRKSTFAEALEEGIEGDRRQGFTRIGPHRADLIPILDGQPAQERISRGQQKQLVAALMLAQAHVYQTHQGRPCIFLVDDLASELDDEHRNCVLQHLRSLGAQVIMTAIEEEAIDGSIWPEQRRFHVEHGRVEEVIY
ncbi:MAG: DNA replication/repair protein RecF [Gammaproteobacteria bacterium]|nr:DNA replication/repair protein RecF [Gammaproteobacteria bacterium]